MLSYILESVWLHGGDSWVALWRVLGYMVGVLSYMGESVCLHGGLLGYMVGCWVTWWGLLDCIVGSLGLHVGVLGYMVGGGVLVTWLSVGLHGRVLSYMVWIVW